MQYERAEYLSNDFNGSLFPLWEIHTTPRRNLRNVSLLTYVSEGSYNFIYLPTFTSINRRVGDCCM
jgi:hypothetical protein